jgi:hypothetical protein
VYLYAKSTKLLQNSNYFAAYGLYAESLKMNPLRWKTYVRLIQKRAFFVPEK